MTTVELELEDGKTWPARRDAVLGCYLVRGLQPLLGDSVTLDGVRREVALITRLPNGSKGLHLLPDFEMPACQPCRDMAPPPTPEDCRTACMGRSFGL